MLTLLRTLLDGQHLDQPIETLHHLAERTAQLLSPAEDQQLQWLLAQSAAVGTLPTGQLFLQHFPECKLAYLAAPVLDQPGLQHALAAYVHTKQRQALGKRLLELSSLSLQDPQGLTLEHLEELRQALPAAATDPTQDCATPSYELYEAGAQRRGTGRLYTYIPEVDAAIGGIEVGTVTVLAGYTGSGKTQFALNMAYKAARAGLGVVYLSLEVSARDLRYSLLSLHSCDPKFGGTPLPVAHIRQHLLTAEQTAVFQTVCADFDEHILPNLRLYTEEHFTDFSQGEVRDFLLRCDDARRVDVVFLDQASLLKYYSKSVLEAATGAIINAYTSFFRRLSLNFRQQGTEQRQLSVVLLAQCNRQGWLRASGQKNKDLEGMYDPVAVSEAHELERCASYLLTVYSTAELRGVQEARVQLLKSRWGAAIEVPIKVRFDPVHALFGELEQRAQSTVSVDPVPQYSAFTQSGAANLGIDLAALAAIPQPAAY